MKMRAMAIMGIVAMASQLAMADASYEHTSQITGGQFVDTLKNVPFISKQMRSMTDPISEITMVHGNQKAVVSKDYTEITDLDKEVIIHIDNTKKTYSVMTFADMRKMIEEMPQRMAQMQQQMKDTQAKAKQAQAGAPQVPPNLHFDFNASVADPGVTKVVNGQNAKQQILTLKMTVTDTNDPTTNIAYTMTTEIWTTPDVPAEMKEVQDFDKRFGEKLMQGVDTKEMMANWAKMRTGQGAMMAQMFGGKPGSAEAFAQMEKEMAKITGTRIMEIQRMGGSGTGIQQQPATQGTPGATAAQPANGGSVAGQVASDTAKGTASGESGRLGIPGSALGGALMNAWNRKKAKPATPPPAAAPAATPTTPAGQAAPVDVTLMEMTTQTHNFSTEAIPTSIFAVPAGYKQVQSPMQQAMSK